MYRNGLTIAIPNWNHELVLPRAIHSALASIKAIRSHGGDGEVLVVDAQSRDGSLTLLRQLEALLFSEGLRVLALAQDDGLAATRNLALSEARYRHIAFLDADNELIPENTPIMWQALCETNAAGAYGTLLMRNPSATDVFEVVSNESFQDGMFDANSIDAFAMFDCGQLIDAGQYMRTFLMHEDHELWLHLATNGRQILFVPVVFGYYTIMPVSGRAADPIKAIEMNQRLRRIFNQLKSRHRLPVATRHSRYHPAVGYV